MKAIMLANEVGINPKIEDPAVEEALKEHYKVDDISSLLTAKPDLTLKGELESDALSLISRIKIISEVSPEGRHSAPAAKRPRPLD